MDHGVFKRPQEVLLELEMWQLLLLQETHGQLTESIERKESNVGVLVAADLIEVLAEDLPHVRPL